MAPILIDSRDILKLGLISVLTVVLIFAGGFFTGHQRAATFYQAGSEVRALSLPAQDLAMESIAGSQMPEIIEAGEEIDVDHPEVVMHAEAASVKLKNNSATEPVAVNLAEKRKATVLPITAAAKTENIEQKTLQKDKVIAEKRTTGSKKTDSESSIIKEIVSTVDTSIKNTLSLDELSKIKYSVQVGMYGSLVNAENMMKMLQAQHYDAYVTDYTNRKNEVRYNVRFGYFTDKQSAIEKLTGFKTGQKNGAYLVRFSAENIVNVAGAADIDKIADEAVRIEKNDSIIPVPVPAAVMPDNISSADVIKNTLLGNL